MKSLVVFASQYGSTAQAAQWIQEDLGEADLLNLKDRKAVKEINPADYEALVIGGSIKVGRLHKKVMQWMEKNHRLIADRKHAFFICCLAQEEEEQDQLDQYWSCFPEDLRNSAAAQVCVGGEMKLEKMNFIIRSMMKKITGSDENIHRLNREKARELAKAVKA